jgi:hypothetical protein
MRTDLINKRAGARAHAAVFVFLLDGLILYPHNQINSNVKRRSRIILNCTVLLLFPRTSMAQGATNATQSH